IEGLSKRVERLHRVDAQFKHIYLSLPEQSRGAVRSGRALNFFLNICGNAAESQEIYREQIRDEIAGLKLEVTKAETEPDKDRQRVELERIQPLLEEAVLKQKLLDQLSAKAILTPEHLRKISYERGTIGGQLVISPRDGALPLNWPTYFVRNDNEYGTYRSLIEAAKATALEELKAGTGITVETQTTLMTATDDLTKKFNRDQERKFRTGQVGSWERIESRNFITTLRAGVLRFVKARELSDVQPTVPFEGSRIDELLAYMSRQGLRFHESDTNGEYVYDLLYRQMVDYYLALHSVQRSIESDEQAIETLTSKENKLFEQEHRSTVDDLIAALQAKQPRDFAEQIRDFGAGVRGVGEGWNKVFGTRDRGGPQVPSN
ncbi:MAG: hypothetical protein ABI614_27625, partial [Planctomycetota bacterium]